MLLIQLKTIPPRQENKTQDQPQFIRHHSGSHPRQHSCMKICREISTTNDLKETMALSAVLKNFITIGHKVSDHQLHHQIAVTMKLP
jgi:hypothetical protein